MIGLAALVAVALIGALFEKWRGTQKLSALKELLSTEGHILDVEALIPDRGSNAADNAAATGRLLEKVNALPDLDWDNPVWRIPSAMEMKSPGRAECVWKRSSFPMEDMLTEEKTGECGWEDLRGPISSVDGLAAELAALLESGRFDAGVEYTEGLAAAAGVETPMAVTKLRGRLAARALLALRDGHHETAVRMARLLLLLADALEMDRLIISQLFRQGVAREAFGVVWELLAADGWDDAVLADLERRCGGMKFLDQMRKCYEMEMAMNLREFDLYRTSDVAVESALETAAMMEEFLETGPAGPFYRSRLHVALWRSVWLDQDAWNALRGWRDPVMAMRAAAEDWKSPKTRELFAKLDGGNGGAYFENAVAGAERSGWYDRTRYLMSSLESLLGHVDEARQSARMEALAELARTAIALKRFKLRTGAFPETLDALEGDCVDPLADGSLGYRLRPDGSYLLYSVGADGVDDGGDARPSEGEDGENPLMDGRDLVWPEEAPAGMD